MDAVNSDASKLWSAACAAIRAKIPARVYAQWFEGIIPIRMDKKKIILGVSDDYFEQWLGLNYSDVIADGLLEAAGKPIKFELEPGHQAEIAAIRAESVSNASETEAEAATVPGIEEEEQQKEMQS